MLKHLSLLLFLSFLSFTVQAEVVISSPETRVSLLELYTSEGCSSCPPADRWLSKLKSDKRLWQSVVPVAFHVDYWNYIGWKDRFSSPKYSERQRRYARSKNLKTVYTPGFLLNGEEWRSFFGLRKLSVNSSENVGVLKLTINDTTLTANFRPTNSMIDEKLILNIAVLGFDIKTDVKAGENNNKVLTHDFTVLGHKFVSLDKGQKNYRTMTTLPDIIETTPNMAVSAWISKVNDMTPIQAVGGWVTKL